MKIRRKRAWWCIWANRFLTGFNNYKKKLPLNTNKKIKTQHKMSTPKRVFIGSAHADAVHVDTLKKHLKLYERQKLIQIWDESMLLGGANLDLIIQELLAAEIILLLFSPDLLAEDFLYSEAMQEVLAKVKRREVQLIPILVRPSGFSDTEFSAYAAVPQRDKPITNYTNEDQAWTIVVDQIKQSIQLNSGISDPEPTPTIPQSLINEVNDAIRSGSTDKALAAIIQWAHANNQMALKNGATVLKASLEKVKREEMLGMLSFQESAREHAKINNGVLELLKTT
jgi:Effector-associated domain 11